MSMPAAATVTGVTGESLLEARAVRATESVTGARFVGGTWMFPPHFIAWGLPEAHVRGHLAGRVAPLPVHAHSECIAPEGHCPSANCRPQ